MFNLEQAIQSWKRSLKKSLAFQEGQIKEMESHLKDVIDEFIVEGLAEQEAFNQTVEKFGIANELGDKVYKTKITKIDVTLAYDIGYYLIKSKPQYKEEFAEDGNVGKFVTVMGQQQDGSWKFLLNKFSPAPFNILFADTSAHNSTK